MAKSSKSTRKSVSKASAGKSAARKRSVAAKRGAPSSKKLPAKSAKSAKKPAKAAPKKAAPAKSKAKKPAKAAPKKAVVKAAPKKPAPAKASAKAPSKVQQKVQSQVQSKAQSKVQSKSKPAAKPVAKPVAARPVPAKAPVKAAAKAPVKVPVKAAIPAKPAKPSKPFSAKKLGDFACGDYVVYPTHGVGLIEAIEEQDIAGFTLRLYVIRFEKEKMTLRVPVNKVEEAGLRKLSTRNQIDVALTTLRGRSRVSRAMWSRRAQEYEAKINSGDPVSIAEVVRDLHRNAGQPDQSYSERQIYEAALERLARELAAVEKIETEAATAKLEQVLGKAA